MMKAIATICIAALALGCRAPDIRTSLIGEWESDTVATFFGDARFDCTFQTNGIVSITRHYAPPYGEGTLTSSYTITGRNEVTAPLEKNRDFIFTLQGRALQLAVTIPNPTTSNTVEYVWTFRKRQSSQQVVAIPLTAARTRLPTAGERRRSTKRDECVSD